MSASPLFEEPPFPSGPLVDPLVLCPYFAPQSYHIDSNVGRRRVASIAHPVARNSVSEVSPVEGIPPTCLFGAFTVAIKAEARCANSHDQGKLDWEVLAAER